MENKLPAKVESRYRLASITKPMTAVGILELVEQGKIDLDAQVQTYVPYFPKKRWPITIRQLLGHLGGISHYRNYSQESGTTRQMTTQEAMSIFADWELLHEPGSKYSYTTYGYNLLGAVIEGASGQSYEEFMTANVWGPLDMQSTTLDYLLELIPNRVRGYQKQNSVIKNSRPVNTSLKFAGGCTRSTVLDMVKFAQGLSDGKVLSKSSLEMMWTRMIQSDRRHTGYGMGWGITNFSGYFTVTHGGAQEGTRTALFHLPEKDLTVAAASNLEGSNPRQFAFRLIEILLQEPANTPAPYVGGPSGNARYQAMRFCFNDGFTFYDYHRRPFSESKEKLKAAFSYLNRVVEKMPINEITQFIDNGRHPVSDWAFAQVGSFMAAEIEKNLGKERLDRLHGAGVLAFFNDYLSVAQKSGALASTGSLSKSLMKNIKKWQQNWQATWTDEVRRVRITADSSPAQIGKKLKKHFHGYHFYPDFSEQFGDAIKGAYLQGDVPKALSFGEQAVKVYPESDEATGSYGIISVLADKGDQGKKWIRKSTSLNPNGVASQGRLNGLAYELAGAGKADDGMKLLQVAVELNPKVANLYDSIGEFYLMKRDTTNSIRYYKKALEVNPEFANPKRMLEQITGPGTN